MHKYSTLQWFWSLEHTQASYKKEKFIPDFPEKTPKRPYFRLNCPLQPNSITCKDIPNWLYATKLVWFRWDTHKT